MHLEIRQLAHFGSELKRDVLQDALQSSVRVPDRQLLTRCITYGNAFLERHKALAEDENCVVWFDVHWGEPAQVGMTWAYHPLAPFDDLYCVPSFWRMWSERKGVSDGKQVYSLEAMQQDFAAYTLQNVTA